jgi:hypothetical protein
MQKISSVVGLLMLKPILMIPSNLSLEKRILDKSLYEVDNSDIS